MLLFRIETRETGHGPYDFGAPGGHPIERCIYSSNIDRHRFYGYPAPYQVFSSNVYQEWQEDTGQWRFAFPTLEDIKFIFSAEMLKAMAEVDLILREIHADRYHLGEGQAIFHVNAFARGALSELTTIYERRCYADPETAFF